MTRRNLAAAALLTCLLAPAAAQAQQPPAGPSQPSAARAAPVSLEHALELFRRGNLELLAQRYDLEAARADVIAAGVLPNPTIGMGAALTVTGQPQGGRQSYQVSVDQVLPIAGQVGLRQRVAGQYATAAERDFAAAAFSLGYDVRDAYADLQAAQARHELLSSWMRELGRVETIISERASAGANPEYDRLRVVVERNNLAGRLAEAAVELAAARAALAQAIGPGVNAANLDAESEVPEAPDPPRDIDAVASLAVARRPEVAAAHARTSAASARIQQLRREYIPSPDLQLGYNVWNHMPSPSGDTGGAAVLVGVAVPLPLFDRGQGRVDRAMAEQQSQRLRAQNVELGVRRETSRAAQTMAARVDAWRRYRDTTAGQVDRLKAIAQSAYREGKSGVLELLDAYRAHLESRERAIELKSQAWKSALALERAVGPR